MDDSCGKCSAPLGQRARVCLQCGATRVPSVAVDAVQDAPIEVGGTVEEIETTSPVEAALPVTPSEERAEPSPLKVEASVGPETIATEAVSVEVANSPDHAQDEIPAPSGNEDFIFPGLIEILQEHIAVQVSNPKAEPFFNIDVDAPPTEMSKICTMMQVVVNKWAFDNVDTAGSAIFIPFESRGPAYLKFQESDFYQLFFVEDNDWKDCYMDFRSDSRAAAILISRLILDFYGYDKNSTLKFEKNDWPDYGLNSQGTFIKSKDDDIDHETDTGDTLRTIVKWIGGLTLAYFLYQRIY